MNKLFRETIAGAVHRAHEVLDDLCTLFPVDGQVICRVTVDDLDDIEDLEEMYRKDDSLEARLARLRTVQRSRRAENEIQRLLDASGLAGRAKAHVVYDESARLLASAAAGFKDTAFWLVAIEIPAEDMAI